MDQNNGPEAKISQEEIRITLMMDLQDFFLHPIEISFPGPSSYMKTIIRTTEYHMIDGQTSHSIEIMEIDVELNLSTSRMGTGETIEIFLILYRLKEDTSQKIILIAHQEVINLTTLRSADQTIDLQLD